MANACLWSHYGITASKGNAGILESKEILRFLPEVSLARMCCFGCQSFQTANRTSFSTAVSAASDLALAIYPVRLISKLQMPFRVKLGLAAIFALGFV